jgi:hypothetical protein
MEDEIKRPTIFNLELKYKQELQELKELEKDKDSNNILNRLENKDIYLFSISLAIKNGLKPQKSKKGDWFVRSEYFDRDKQAFAILKSLIYDYSGREIKILLSENYANFFELCEGLANAGMEKTIELIKQPNSIEKEILSHES